MDVYIFIVDDIKISDEFLAVLFHRSRIVFQEGFESKPVLIWLCVCDFPGLELNLRESVAPPAE